MKRTLQALWEHLVNGALTLTAAITVVMLCVVAFSARQPPHSSPVTSVDVDSAAAATQSSASRTATAKLAAAPSQIYGAPASPAQQNPPTRGATASPATPYEYVHGYKKKDGTVIQGYYRTKADGDKGNNWSEKGNVNPFTGKPGTQNP